MVGFFLESPRIPKMFQQIPKVARDSNTKKIQNQENTAPVLLTLRKPVGGAWCFGRLLGNRSLTGPLWTMKNEHLKEQVSQAAVCACARSPRPSCKGGPDGGRGYTPLPWQPGPGGLGSRCYRGSPSPCQILETGGEESSPAISVTSAAASYTGRRGYRGREGKDDAEIFVGGETVTGKPPGTTGRKCG